MIMFIDRSLFVTKVNSDKPIANNIYGHDWGADLAETTKTLFIAVNFFI
jgi:hypothetical protein